MCNASSTIHFPLCSSEVEHDDDFGYECTEVEVVMKEEGAAPTEVAKEDEIVPGTLERALMR
jgi:hypothetical protein